MAALAGGNRRAAFSLDEAAGRAAVLAKCHEILAASGRDGAVAPVRPSGLHARDLMAAMVAMAPHDPVVANAAANPAASLAADFAAFLRLHGSGLVERMAAAPDGPEPQQASQESRAPEFWRFAALVQDVWEHTLDPAVRARDAAVLDCLSALRPQRVYDFGAGGGFFALALAASAIPVRCNENNALKRAFLRFRRERHPEAQLILGRADRPGWPAALAIDVIDHLHRPADGLAALADRLAPGGTLFIQAAFPDDGWHAGALAHAGPAWEILHARFTPVAAGERLARAGLMVWRKRAAPVDILPWSAGARDAGRRVCLNPAAAILPVTGQPGARMVAVPWPIADTLLIADSAAPLVEACREPVGLAELVALGASAGDAAEIIDALLRARLAYIAEAA